MSADWFPQRLRELRAAAGLTQQALAAKTREPGDEKDRVSVGTVRDLEQGRVGPTWDTVLALAKALGVDCTAFTQAPAEEAEAPKRGRPKRRPAEGE